MLRARNELEKYIESLNMKAVFNQKTCLGIIDYCYDNYGIDAGIVSDFITMRRSLTEATEFELFILFDAYRNSKEIRVNKSFSEYYTEQEIKTYSNTVVEKDELKFPIVFKMIEVVPDQWIGKISSDVLMEFNKHQIINYNVNAQRTMQKIIRGDKEYYKIKIDRNAVEAIRNSLENNEFIPNTITLNIPADSNADFYYNEDKMELVINSIDHFDITDGYHRFLAMCNQTDKDEKFKYEMELRIVNFDDNKAKSFIYQEDQKTKMTKIDSESFNMNKSSNIVVERVNNNVGFNLKGAISNNGGQINYAMLSSLIDYFYFSNVSKDENVRVVISKAVQDNIENFNILTEYDEKYMSKNYSNKELLIIMTVFSYFKDDKKDLGKCVDYVLANADKIDGRKMRTLRANEKLTSNIYSIIEEV